MAEAANQYNIVGYVNNENAIIGLFKIVDARCEALACIAPVTFKWREKVVGECYPGVVEDGNMMVYLKEHTFAKLRSFGYDPQNGEHTAVLRPYNQQAIINDSFREKLSGETKQFIRVGIANLIANFLVPNGTDSDLERVISELGNLGMKRNAALHQIRHSLFFRFETYFRKVDSFLETKTVSQFKAQAPINQLVYLIMGANHEGQPLFIRHEHCHFALIMAIYANVKKFNRRNYDRLTKKRYQAFCSQCHLISQDMPPFLPKLFPKETISEYHDYLPKVLRKALYESIFLENGEVWPWKTYLKNVVMEWNGMILIKEAHKAIVGLPRRFLVIERYASEIKTFMTWWSTHEHLSNFKYSWYAQPEILTEVTHAKLPHLYSVVLKIAKSEGRLTKYRAAKLNHEAIPDTDIDIMYELIPAGVYKFFETTLMEMHYKSSLVKLFQSKIN